MTKLVEHAPVDAACDQMAKKYMTDALPPVITEGKNGKLKMLFIEFFLNKEKQFLL